VRDSPGGRLPGSAHAHQRADFRDRHVSDVPAFSSIQQKLYLVQRSRRQALLRLLQWLGQIQETDGADRPGESMVASVKLCKSRGTTASDVSLFG
jgi:hypothetical protein